VDDTGPTMTLVGSRVTASRISTGRVEKTESPVISNAATLTVVSLRRNRANWTRSMEPKPVA
jgi:hypothetical protein